MGGIYWLASYPKSGNTWVRAFLQNLRADGEAPMSINELDTGTASARGWLDDVLGFDTADLTHAEVERLRPVVYRWALRDPGVDYRKIHDAYTLTADGEPLVSREATLGALYIIRNPLDVAPSYANHNHCSVDEAITHMADPGHGLSCSRKRLPHQVRQRLLTWSGHVSSWVNAPGLAVEVVRYEDLLSDPGSTFARAARFLQLPHEAPRVAKAIRFSAFTELARQEGEKGFRERPQGAARFFCQGRSGGWRDKLNDRQVARIIADHADVMRRFGYLDA